ncbi:MAG: PIN domain-containing protein [Cytophagales bacterium]|nr:PIN domain-containing protein [Cytophagales bacterium]MCA6366321.1 PIN domain-containing protein [Cytophagales bacterium]MCA6371419.1 PIN domain-containing protein [Cytophagales bacterium]MCA6374573.1 PIN domain-containing protein [Cytophagales bacterium]MCA6386163.1 PIN domain-containing protein [Cytophagales bacterium]
MTELKVFIDSNIIVYLVDNRSKEKTKKAQDFLSPDFFISTQVITENVNVCLKKLHLNKETTFDFARRILNRFRILQITEATLLKSFEISIKYQLSSWDSIITATAILNNCSIIYSEDMQDGLIVENSVTIINPFK